MSVNNIEQNRQWNELDQKLGIFVEFKCDMFGNRVRFVRMWELS